MNALKHCKQEGKGEKISVRRGSTRSTYRTLVVHVAQMADPMDTNKVVLLTESLKKRARGQHSDLVYQTKVRTPRAFFLTILSKFGFPHYWGPLWPAQNPLFHNRTRSQSRSLLCNIRHFPHPVHPNVQHTCSSHHVDLGAQEFLDLAFTLSSETIHSHNFNRPCMHAHVEI